jgi:hypothetical protein
MNLLHGRAVAEESESVRGQILKELSRPRPHFTPRQDLFFDRAQNDSNWSVRMAALESIATLWPNDMRTRQILESCVLSEEVNTVRKAALQALVHLPSPKESMLEFLLDQAVMDQDYLLRRTSLELLARNWERNLRVEEVLSNRVKLDPNEYVRKAAEGLLDAGRSGTISQVESR